MRRFALLASVFVVALASATQPTAEKLMTEAKVKAKKEGKNVLVVFHASWCGWCKRFDKMLEEPSLKPKFDKSFVIVHLDVMESKDKAELENPGGVELMEALGGKEAGLPFYAVVDPSGKKIADSLRVPGNARSNTGHPAAPEEIAHFMEVLKKTAKKTDGKSRTEIETYLKASAKS